MNIDEINDRTVYTVVCRRMAVLVSFVTTDTRVVVLAVSPFCQIQPISFAIYRHSVELRSEMNALRDCRFLVVFEQEAEALDENYSDIVAYAYGAAWLAESLVLRYGTADSAPGSGNLAECVARLALATNDSSQEIATLEQRMEHICIAS